MAGKTREIREGENKNKMILYNLSRLMTSIAILIIVEEFYKALFKKKVIVDTFNLKISSDNFLDFQYLPKPDHKSR